MKALCRERRTAGFTGTQFNPATEQLVAVSLDYRVGLDLDQHVRIDESRHLDHRGGRRMVPESLPVRFADFGPAPDVRDKHARANHVLEATAGCT